MARDPLLPGGRRRSRRAGSTGSNGAVPWRSLVAACLLLCGVVRGLAASPTEYEVKATFLYHFVQFIEWPASAFRAPDDPIVIGILGADPFDGALERVVGGEVVRGRRVQVRALAASDDPRTVQLLFIGRSEAGRAGAIIARLDGAPVLTVGESEGFCRLGGMINFTLVDQRVRFEINDGRADRARLAIPSRLLNLATIVADGG